MGQAYGSNNKNVINICGRLLTNFNETSHSSEPNAKEKSATVIPMKQSFSVPGLKDGIPFAQLRQEPMAFEEYLDTYGRRPNDPISTYQKAVDGKEEKGYFVVGIQFEKLSVVML